VRTRCLPSGVARAAALPAGIFAMRSLEVGWSHIAEFCRHGQKARITYLAIDAERLKGQKYTA
jgi:hypothetical protein